MRDDHPNSTLQARERMVLEQIESRGVKDPLVLEAMRTVPRHVFTNKGEQYAAYDDRPLPIGHGQTISQPYIVAYMTEALKLSGGEKVLEIGTGKGYQAAVLSRIAAEVFTIERIPELAERARLNFKQLGYDNINVMVGDGTRGWEEAAPFQGILVTAGGPRVPQNLRNQLAVGARLVIPVGGRYYGQRIIRVERKGEDRFIDEELLSVAFVPLIGESGWDSDA